MTTKKKRRSQKSPTAKRSTSTLAAEITTLRDELAALKSQVAAGKKTKRRSTRPGGRKSLTARPTKMSTAKFSGPLPIELLPSATPPTNVYELQAARSASSGTNEGLLFAGLLDRARLQWLLRDWHSLASLDLTEIEHDRHAPLLALLAAAGCLQMNDRPRARDLLAYARSRGCAESLMARVLASGAYLSLAKAASLRDRQALAARHEQSSAILLGTERLISSHAENREALPKHASEPEESASAFDPTGAVALSLSMASGRVETLHLKCRYPQHFSMDGQGVNFDASKGPHLYFVSNETGDFEKAPNEPLPGIAAGRRYNLSGRMAVEGGATPIVWIFQYAQRRKIRANSLPTSQGAFGGSFETLPETEAVCLGVRLSGKGRWLLDDSGFELRPESGSVGSQSLEQRIESIKKDQNELVASSMRQIEACVRLQHYLGPDIILPDTHNWMVSPDFGVLLVNLIEENTYDAVVEFGSGTSTVLAAKALQRVATIRGGPPVPFISFDHLEEYCEKTRRRLIASRLLDGVELVLAPLGPWEGPDGDRTSYYQCREALGRFKERIPTDRPRILVIVDGPPAATGPLARYPALPMLLDILGSANQYHFLLDDMIRDDERQVSEAWQALLQATGIPTATTEYNKLEKKALLLTVN